MRQPQLVLKDIRFAYRPNFSGEKRQFNDEGDRNFTIRFDNEEVARQLASEGWNIKEKEELETGVPFWTLEVTVRFEHVPPMITRVGSLTKKQTMLDADTVGLLDSDGIIRADVSLNPYRWEVNGQTGIKAYLANMYVLVEESELELLWGRMLDTWDGDEPIFES